MLTARSRSSQRSTAQNMNLQCFYRTQRAEKKDFEPCMGIQVFALTRMGGACAGSSVSSAGKSQRTEQRFSLFLTSLRDLPEDIVKVEEKSEEIKPQRQQAKAAQSTGRSPLTAQTIRDSSKISEIFSQSLSHSLRTPHLSVGATSILDNRLTHLSSPLSRSSSIRHRSSAKVSFLTRTQAPACSVQWMLTFDPRWLSQLCFRSARREVCDSAIGK